MSGVISSLIGSAGDSSLYPFTSFTFTNAGVTGRSGPTLAQCLASYNTTTYPWLSNTSNFNVVTQGYQLWTVPADGTYTIDAYGARGGSGYGTTYPGGQGARIKGDFVLTKGTKLRIVVGQMGTDGTTSSGSASGGGGGGTFVMKETGTTNIDIYVVAGGGGGTSWYGGGLNSGTNAASTSSTGAGGAAGSGTGGCGGGSITADGVTSGYGAAGIGFYSTAVGGDGYGSTNGLGGFGGGGGQGFSGAGGGGGQTGGKGGDNAAVSAGLGAFSYNNGTNQTNTGSGGTGHGSVTITKL